MKIIQLVGSLEHEAAGPSYSVPRLAKALVSEGHECTLMSLGLPGEVTTMGVPHHRFKHQYQHLFPLSKLRFSGDMKRALRKAGDTTDIVHSNGLWTMVNTYPLSLNGRGRASVVVSPRGMLSSDALSFSQLPKRIFSVLRQRKALGRCDMFHATSALELQDIRASGFMQPVAIVPNGIDLPDLSMFGSKAVGRVRTVAFIGRLHPIKQIENLISAWVDVAQDFPSWRLMIHGPGDSAYRGSLEEYAQLIGAKRCTLGGAVYGLEKGRLFRDADLVVLPSRSENFGMTVAESLSFETPVITTVGTPWRGLNDNVCGWWVGQGKGPLAVALAEAMSMPVERLRNMGKSGRAWMGGSFSWEAVARDMASAYEWLRVGGELPEVVSV